MTRSEFIEALRKSPIWAEDRYGHFKLNWKDIQYRLKIQDRSVRYEKRYHDYAWFNNASDYFRNVTVIDGRLKIQEYLIPIDQLPA